GPSGSRSGGDGSPKRVELPVERFGLYANGLSRSPKPAAPLKPPQGLAVVLARSLGRPTRGGVDDAPDAFLAVDGAEIECRFGPEQRICRFTRRRDARDDRSARKGVGPSPGQVLPARVCVGSRAEALREGKGGSCRGNAGP